MGTHEEVNEENHSKYVKLNLFLEVQENPRSSSTAVAANNDICTSYSRVKKNQNSQMAYLQG